MKASHVRRVNPSNREILFEPRTTRTNTKIFYGVAALTDEMARGLKSGATVSVVIHVCPPTLERSHVQKAGCRLIRLIGVQHNNALRRSHLTMLNPVKHGVENPPNKCLVKAPQSFGSY